MNNPNKTTQKNKNHTPERATAKNADNRATELHNSDPIKQSAPINTAQKKEIEYIKVNKEKFDIAIQNIKLAEAFLMGISVMSDKAEYNINHFAHELSNAVQWLHNWGDEKNE